MDNLGQYSGQQPNGVYFSATNRDLVVVYDGNQTTLPVVGSSLQEVLDMYDLPFRGPYNGDWSVRKPTIIQLTAHVHDDERGLAYLRALEGSLKNHLTTHPDDGPDDNRNASEDEDDGPITLESLGLSKSSPDQPYLQ